MPRYWKKPWRNSIFPPAFSFFFHSFTLSSEASSALTMQCAYSKMNLGRKRRWQLLLENMKCLFKDGYTKRSTSMIQCHLHCFSTSFLFLHPTPPQDSRQPLCKSNWRIQNMKQKSFNSKIVTSVFSWIYAFKCWIFNWTIKASNIQITRFQTPIHVSYKLLRYPLGAPYTSPPCIAVQRWWTWDLWETKRGKTSHSVP